MSSGWVNLLGSTEPHGHVVQLYGEDDALLYRNVGAYLGEGLTRGDVLLVLATAAHADGFLRQLERNGHDPAAAAAEGRLVLLDAEETLARILVDGEPDRGRFDEVIGGAVAMMRARSRHGLRAYGELVGLLWTAGRSAAAIRLERYWNRLLGEDAFSLFCAYPIDLFGGGCDGDMLDAVLCSHTHVLPADPAFEAALDRALVEVLGEARAAELPARIRADYRATWAAIPRVQAIVLWLRRNLPVEAGEILARARNRETSSAHSADASLRRAFDRGLAGTIVPPAHPAPAAPPAPGSRG